MANPLQICIDDMSPTITYYPFADTFGTPDLLAGWNPYYTDSGYAAYQGQIGVGTSLHRTSLDGASCSVQWNGTGIRLYGNASQASYNLTLDGTPVQTHSSSPADGILADLQNLSDTIHTLILTVQTSSSPSADSFVDFDKACVTFTSAPDDNNSTLVTQTFKDTDIAFLGQWSYVSAIDTISQNLSFHYSVNTGDRFQITFQGRAISLIGIVSDATGKYSVTMDNQTTTLSGESSFFYPDALLYYATDVDDTRQHQLVVQNMEDRVLALMVDGVNYTAVQNATGPTSTSSLSNATSTNSRGTIAAVVLASVLTFTLLAMTFCYVLVYRPRTRRQQYEQQDQRRREKEAEAGGDVLDISAERRSFSGVSLRFGGLLFGIGSQQSKSDVMDAGSNASHSSSKRRSQADHDDFHKQWEAHTFNLPSMSYHASRGASAQQLGRHPSWPLQSPRMSTGARSGHSQLESAAQLLNDERTRDNDDKDVRTTQTKESDDNWVAEFSLSPRTSEARYLRQVGNPNRSQLESKRRPSETPNLDIMEGSPFMVDSFGASGPSKGFRASQQSQIQSQAELYEKPQESGEQHTAPKDGKRSSQVRFDTSAGPHRVSFFDFGSTPPSSDNSNNDSTSSFPINERDQLRWSAASSAPRTEPPSASQASVTLDVSPMPPPPARPQGPRFSYRTSTSTSGYHRQSFGADPPRLQPALGLSTLQPLAAVAPSSYHYTEPSPTDSAIMSVSEIQFRRMDMDADERRTSTGSQHLPAYAPVPSNLHTLPELPTPPLIVQKLLGKTGGSQTPRPDPSSVSSRDVQPPTTEAPASAHREIESEPRTPFLQRLFGIGAAILGPRHNPRPSQDIPKLSPESLSSSRPRPPDT